MASFEFLEYLLLFIGGRKLTAVSKNKQPNGSESIQTRLIRLINDIVVYK